MRLTVGPLAWESHNRGGEPVEGALKLFTLALRIAVAWTLLSLLFTAFWVLLLEVGRRFGGRPASRPPAREERQLSAEVRAIYGDFVDDRSVHGEGFAHCEPDETAGRDAIILIQGTASTRER